MGMNMVSKGCEAAVGEVQKRFKQARLVALSGNVCTDKKSSAQNWVEGRGKSIVVSSKIQNTSQPTLLLRKAVFWFSMWDKVLTRIG